MITYKSRCLVCVVYLCRIPGRPLLEISVEKIEYLRHLRFSWTKIADILGVSRSTLYRRLDREGIDLTTTYSNINDHELDRIVKSIKESHPNDGERLLIGHLSSLGIILPRSRIRASIHRVDPINTAIRRSIAIQRRVYCVSGPNSLWHIDGHHKLIKYRFVTHGGIDGFSIVYLRCSTNNTAPTVLASFADAVSKYGIPNQVRSDQGGENVDVWRYMLEQTNSDSAVVVGASTHNQRIERLWRDVHRCVSSVYGDLFRIMEDDEKLNCLNEVDLFCLHTVFLPRINDHLDSFVECLNNHALSTSNNLTPNQLFIQGALRQNMIPVFPTSTPITNSLQLPSSNNAVSVPRSTFTPCDHLLRELDQRDMLQESDDFGYRIYRRVCYTIGLHLQHCSDCSY